MGKGELMNWTLLLFLGSIGQKVSLLSPLPSPILSFLFFFILRTYYSTCECSNIMNSV